ncbi:MAG: DUF6285 domain-containing protein [Pseudomonadota bacterium]|nr:DUF6285 domain-containing protein [Pseudomonadota bacterium]
MINRPDTHNLLTEARRVLLESIAPELAGEKKYEALMVANAMGMAAREMESHTRDCCQSADDQVTRLLGSLDIEIDDQEPEALLADLIRNRSLEVDDPDLRSLLYSLTRARLAINNPGYLES